MIKGLLCENIAIVGMIDPDAYAAGTYTTGWIDMKLFHQLMFAVQAGTFGTDATLDFKLQEAKDSSGTSSQDLTGKSITQFTDAGTDDDKQAIVNMRADELSDGYTHVRGSLTIAVAAVDAGVLAIGGQPRYLPASNFDATTVDEIVE